MYRNLTKFFIIAVLMIVMGSLASVVSAKEKFKEEGTFALSAAANGDEDTLTFVIAIETGDKLEIGLDIDSTEGEWELVLEDPDGNEVGVMTHNDVDNADASRAIAYQSSMKDNGSQKGDCHVTGDQHPVVF